jgi:hypothetical protein
MSVFVDHFSALAPFRQAQIMKDKRNTTALVMQYLARCNPALFDVLFPRYIPATEIDGNGFMDVQRRYLDPQPLPPRSGGRSRSMAARSEDPQVAAFHIGTAAAEHYLQTLWIANSLAMDLSRVNRIFDDWCGNSPIRLKIPLPLPFPVPTTQNSEWLIAFQLGLFNTLAHVSSDDKTLTGHINKALDKVADKLDNTLEAHAG